MANTIQRRHDSRRRAGEAAGSRRRGLEDVRGDPDGERRRGGVVNDSPRRPLRRRQAQRHGRGVGGDQQGGGCRSEQHRGGHGENLGDRKAGRCPGHPEFGEPGDQGQAGEQEDRRRKGAANRQGCASQSTATAPPAAMIAIIANWTPPIRISCASALIVTDAPNLQAVSRRLRNHQRLRRGKRDAANDLVRPRSCPVSFCSPQHAEGRLSCIVSSAPP